MNFLLFESTFLNLAMVRFKHRYIGLRWEADYSITQEDIGDALRTAILNSGDIRLIALLPYMASVWMHLSAFNFSAIRCPTSLTRDCIRAIIPQMVVRGAKNIRIVHVSGSISQMTRIMAPILSAELTKSRKALRT